MRAPDGFGMLGFGIRILGANAIYGYEVSSGVRIGSGLATIEDIDLLFDARGGLYVRGGRLRLFAAEDTSTRRQQLLTRHANVPSCEPGGLSRRSDQAYAEPSLEKSFGQDRLRPSSLTAVSIESVDWLENSLAFEAVAIDEQGEPVRIVAPDPRVARDRD